MRDTNETAQPTLSQYTDADSDEVPHMDVTEYADWFEQFDFTFATTYAQKGAPHEYLTLDSLAEAHHDRFYKSIVFIRCNGYDMEFWGSDYRVCDIGDYTYWTMGARVDKTTVINRKPVDGYANYVETDSPTPGVNDVS